MIRAAATWLLAISVSGCASVGNPALQDADSIAGRLSIKVDAHDNVPARNVSGSFELQGTPKAGQLNLSSPLGTVLAQARWVNRQAWLTTSDGEVAYPDLDTLTQQMLGQSLPVAALFDWLRGRPWPGAPSHDPESLADKGFQQLGWSVSLARFDEGWISAQRQQAPQVTVRAHVDRP